MRMKKLYILSLFVGFVLQVMAQSSVLTDTPPVTISTTINKSDVFFSHVEAKGDDVEIVCWLNPRINGTRMEAMSLKYEKDGKFTSRQTRVSSYGGQVLPRNGNPLNRGNRVNHGEKFFVTATIKKVAHLQSLNSVTIRVWTSYGEGDVVIRNVKW